MLLAAALLSATAAAATLERVSVSSDEVEGNGESYYPSVSDNGRFVAFCSFADNLVPGDTNGAADTFVRDRLNGATERISVGSDEAEGNGESCDPFIAVSADGRFVAFTSNADNLVAGDSNGEEDAFVRDRQAGATELVSVSSQEEQASFGGRAHSISANGRFVVFDTRVAPSSLQRRIHIRDRQLGTTETSDEFWPQASHLVGNSAFNAKRRFAATYHHIARRRS